MDVPAFREWARFKLGKSRTLFEDAMIAAAAEVHGLPVATSNQCTFRTLDIPLFSPFAQG